MNANHTDPAHWLSLVQVAEILGSTPLNVLMHIKRGLLSGVEDESGWRVDPDAIAALLEKRREGAVPEVCKSGCAKQVGGCGSCS